MNFDDVWTSNINLAEFHHPRVHMLVKQANGVCASTTKR